MPALISHVRTTVDPKLYYEWQFPNVRWPDSGEARIISPMRERERTPSMSINSDSGKWFDHGSGEGGNSIISFHSEMNGISQIEAATELFHHFIHPVVDIKKIRRWHRRLKNTPSFYRYVKDARRISEKIIKAYKIGTDGSRIMIPVKNEYGLVVNIKLYDPEAKKRNIPKMLNWKEDGEERSFGSPPMIFPLSIIMELPQDLPIVICEGEWDALALLSVGIPAVTSTSGSKSWPAQFNELFRRREVIVCYDNDKEGYKGARRVFNNLRDVAQVIRQLRVPESVGKDVSDWINKKPSMRRPETWLKKFDRAKVITENDEDTIKNDRAIPVSLDKASESKYSGKRISVRALVTGKDTSPYLLPRRVRVSCNKTCETCPIAELPMDYKDLDIDIEDPYVLSMIDANKAALHKALFAAAGMHPKPQCKAKIEVLKHFNVEQLIIIPTLDDHGTEYVMRNAFFVGHGMRSNCAYRLEGRTLADPRDQHATHLFDRARPVQDEVGAFEMSPALARELSAFRVKGRLTRRKLLTHLYRIADWQSRNVTKIRQRSDMHIAVDLAFHSVPELRFQNEPIDRAMLDIIIIGDTRCGKGFVTERLTKYYGVGEVASGENCSFAGLVGGCESVGRRFIVKWGVIPLNNGRLVVIDEASALTEDEIGHMSRVRSEGVAEISKIVREQTRANTRLIWLSNPRSGRPIMTYNQGVSAIKELMGSNEDISRLDLALTVASNEVASQVINSKDEVDTSDAKKFPREMCRSLVMWAWSRRRDQVIFTPEAIEAVISKSIEFGDKYSATIPLIQAENVRVKLAKLSAALAARVFNADDTGEKLIVEKAHVLAICDFVDSLYEKPSMAYDVFSLTANKKTVIENEKSIEEAFASLSSEEREQVIEGLLSITQVTADNLADHVGGDMLAAKTLLSELVRVGCITRHERYNFYIKHPPFNHWLRRQQDVD
jgi:5S rRNA maturation endonuclease (ribonuclease M5)